MLQRNLTVAEQEQFCKETYNTQTQANAACMANHPKTGKKIRRFLYTVLLLFVLTGVSAIACFLCVILPRQNAAQVDGAYVSSLRSANVGDSVLMGQYEQDNDLSDGAEEIEWLVLSKQEDRALLISKYALDYAPFSKDSTMCTWDYSTLLQWLNDSFYASAFSSAEKKMVLVSHVQADKNAFFDTDPGRATKSRIFLLSLAEANKYFQTSEDRQCEPTAYAESQGAYAQADGGCGWWLRSPGYDGTAASRVLPDGNFSFIGQPAQRSLAVRPAMWIEFGESENV